MGRDARATVPHQQPVRHPGLPGVDGRAGASPLAGTESLLGAGGLHVP